MRKLQGIQAAIIATWSAFAVLMHLYYTAVGWPEPLTTRALHIGLFLPLAFILFPARKSSKGSVTWLDWTLSIISVLPSIYIYLHAYDIHMRSEYLTPVSQVELILGATILLMLLEAARRALTPVLSVLALLVLAYMYFAHYLPGVWGYREMGLDQIIETMFLISGRGVYGPLMGISATLVTVFIAFGAFVRVSGTGRLFSNFGEAVAGKYSGGPAKVCTVSSGLFGTMSGSAVANVSSTGVITIPLMKKLGYRPAFAGGVETAASVGGAIMPPVMGAASFVMAETTGIPYRDIVIGACLGAALYYFTILVMVHLEAKRLKLAGIPKEDLPSWTVVKNDIHLILPIVVMFALLLWGFTPQLSSFCAIGICILVSWFRKDTRIGLREIFVAVAEAGYLVMIVAVAVGVAGIIVSGLTSTGMVVAIGSIIQSVAGNELWLASILVAVISLLLGMGVPVTPAYLIVSVIGVPVLLDLGAPLLGAHLFVFYFAILADATPPVSVAAFTAAAIAKSPPLRTGFEAWKLTVGGLIVAFSFIFTPSFMWQGPLIDTLLIVIINMVAVCFISIGTIGYLYDKISFLPRIACLVVGMGLGFGFSLGIELRGLIAITAALLIFSLITAKKHKFGLS